MSARKAVVERYFDGFHGSDHGRILACLTDDVVWDLPGFEHLEGKEAFDGEIENEEFTGSPTLVVVAPEPLDGLVERAELGQGPVPRLAPRAQDPAAPGGGRTSAGLEGGTDGGRRPGRPHVEVDRRPRRGVRLDLAGPRRARSVSHPTTIGLSRREEAGRR